MLSFKTFLEESKEQEDEFNMMDADSEHEGLADIYNHILSRKNIDPKIAEYMAKHPSVSTLNESTKEKVKSSIKDALSRYKDAYGSEIGAPIRGLKASELARSAVEAHYKKPEAEQRAALEAAAKRLGHVAYSDSTMTPEKIGERLAGGNKKTDTVVNNQLAKHKGRLTSRVSSYGGAPGNYTHYHNADMTESTSTTTCPHSTTGCAKGSSVRYKGKDVKVRPSCLAMSGGYGFAVTQKKIQINSHIRSGKESLQDHAILAAHHMVTQAEKAAENNTVHAIRGQTTDQRGSDIRAIANEVSKAKPIVKKHTVLFGYSKNPKEVLDAARANKAGNSISEHIVHSHPGPAYHQDDEGNLHLNHENIRDLQKLREAHATAKSEGLPISDYVVAGGKSLDKEGNAIEGTVHRQPKTPSEKTGASRRAKLEQETDRFHNVDSSVKKMRYWDLHHSGELKEGEPESHHDEKTGTGYATIQQGGKKLKIGYYDREANVGATSSGKTSYAKHERHDARYADAETQMPTSHITAPVASTANLPAEGSHGNALIHQMHVSYDMHGNKLAHSQSGMLHDAHPHLMQQAGYEYQGKKKDLGISVASK